MSVKPKIYILKHNQTTLIENNRTEDIKNDEIKTINNDKVLNVNANYSQNVEKEKITTVTQDYDLYVDENFNVNVKENLKQIIEQDFVQRVKGNKITYVEKDVKLKYLQNLFKQINKDFRIDVKENFHVKANTIKIEAQTIEIVSNKEVNLSSGNNIVVNPKGIFINSKLIDSHSSYGGMNAVDVKINDLNTNKSITRTYFTFGSEKIILSSISRHYKDLNFHMETIGYEAGEVVPVSFTTNDEDIITINMTIDKDGKSEQLDIFKDILIKSEEL